jgi:hypothetical protein
VTNYDPLLDERYYQLADNMLVLEIEQGIIP